MYIKNQYYIIYFDIMYITYFIVKKTKYSLHIIILVKNVYFEIFSKYIFQSVV